MFNSNTLLDFIYGIEKEVLRGIYGRKKSQDQRYS